MTVRLKLKGEVKIRYDGGYIENHNDICTDFITLIKLLLTSGIQRAQSYGYFTNFSLPTSICLALLNNGNIVATLTATISYKEDNQYTQYVTYKASNTFSSTICIDCVKLVAVSNSIILYNIALFKFASTLKTNFICVTWTIKVKNCSQDEQSLNNVVFVDPIVPPVPVSGGTLVGTSNPAIFGLEISYKNIASCIFPNFITLPMPVSNFVVLLLLVPINIIQQYDNTYLFQAYSSFAGVNLAQLNGISTIAVFQNNNECVAQVTPRSVVIVPAQQLICGGSGQGYQVTQPCVSQVQGQMVGCKLVILFQETGTYTFATVVFYCIGGIQVLYMGCTRTVSVTVGSGYIVYNLVEVNT